MMIVKGGGGGGEGRIANVVLHTHQNLLLTLAEWESGILQACHRQDLLCQL